MFRRLAKYCCCVKESNSTTENKYHDRNKHIENAIKAIIDNKYEETEVNLRNAQNCDPHFDVTSILDVIKEVQPTNEIKELMKVTEDDIADGKYEEAINNLVRIGDYNSKVNLSHLYQAVIVGIKENNDIAKVYANKERNKVDNGFKKTDDDFDVVTEINKKLIDIKKPVGLLEKSTQTNINDDSESLKFSKEIVTVSVQTGDDLNETTEEAKTSVFNKEITKDIAFEIEDIKNTNIENHLITVINENNESQNEKASKLLEKKNEKILQDIDTHFNDENEKDKAMLKQIDSIEKIEINAENVTKQQIHNNNELTTKETIKLIEDEHNKDFKAEVSIKQVLQNENIETSEDAKDQIANNNKKAVKTPKENDNNEKDGIREGDKDNQVNKEEREKKSIPKNAKNRSQMNPNTSQVNTQNLSNDHVVLEEDTPIIEAPTKKTKNYIEIEKYIEMAVSKIRSDNNFPFRPAELLGRADRLSMATKNSVEDSTLALLLKIKTIDKSNLKEKRYKKACEEFQKGNYENAQVFALLSISYTIDRMCKLIAELNDERYKTLNIEADKTGTLGPFRLEYKIQSYRKLAAILNSVEDTKAVGEYFSILATKALKDYHVGR